MNKWNFVAFGDLHANDWQSCSDILPNGTNTRLQDAVNVLIEIEKYCLREKVKDIICVGDLFETRGVIKVEVFNPILHQVRKMTNVGLRMAFVVGNHDWSSDCTRHSLEAFKGFATVIDKPRTFWFMGRKVYGISYMNDKEQLLKALSKANKLRTICFLHQWINDISVRPGIYTKGLISKGDLPTKTQWNISGNYHQYYRLDNTYFLGAPLQLKWDEIGEKKYFFHFKGKSVKKISQDVTPKFLEIDLTKSPRVDQNLKVLVRGNFVKMKVATANEVVINRLKTLLLRMGVRWIITDFVTEEVEALEPFKSTKLKSLIKEYVRKTETNLDRTELKKLGLKIVKNAVE